ncbi:hypothetical protein AALA44_03260 [Enterococcus ratti]|uniref:hypothetical protein n=1 Tax=Enterococcus ratti TaxID=150033 RepID=UPI003515D740
MNSLKKFPFATQFIIIASLGIVGLFACSSHAAAANYPDNQTADILGGHVQAAISYKKNNSPNYTAIGDTVTVTTTLEKLDNGVLPPIFNQSSMLILFPDETQGLKLEGEPSFVYTKGILSDQGKFVDPSKQLCHDIFWAFNTEAKMMYQDTLSYNGRMTQLPITNQYEDGPYDDTYSLTNILVDKGDKIVLSYKATVTEAALKNKEFILHTGIYDSTQGDFDWNHFLTTKMPAIQSLSVAFDAASKNKVIELTDASSYQTCLTGTWSGSIDDLHPTLSINQQSVTIPVNSFKPNKTFSIPIDLTNYGVIGQNKIHIELKDSNHQVATDDAVVTLVQTDQPPQLKLSTAIANQTIQLTPNILTFKIDGQYKDDSLTEKIYYNLNGLSHQLGKTLNNQNKGKWTDFSQEMPLNELKYGENTVQLYVVDTKGQKSNVETFILQLTKGSVHFKKVDTEVNFPNSVISGQRLYSFPQKPVEISIEDTTRLPGHWQLTVHQITPFKNEKRKLPASLYYQDNLNKLTITANDPVILPVLRENATNYRLQQDQTHQFGLMILPNAYTGEYESKLEWTLIEAP